MKVAIATTSNEKIKGIKSAFCDFFEMEESGLTIISQKVSSDVPDQPFDNNIYLGALNRVNNLKKGVDSATYDYIISCEGGIETFCQDLHFSVQVVCIYDINTNQYYYGKSSGWQVPEKGIELIKEFSLDSYMRSKQINALEELLDGTTRSEHVHEATKNALCTMKKFY